MRGEWGVVITAWGRLGGIKGSGSTEVFTPYCLPILGSLNLRVPFREYGLGL